MTPPLRIQRQVRTGHRVLRALRVRSGKSHNNYGKNMYYRSRWLRIFQDGEGGGGGGGCGVIL